MKHDHSCTHCSRRSFLKGAAAGAGLLTVAPIWGMKPTYAAAGLPNNGRFLVVINLFGGNDGLNTVVPTHLTEYVNVRPDINLIDEGDGSGGSGGGLPAGETLHALSGGYELHYALPDLGQMWTDQELYVINKVGYPSANLSHFTSMDIYSYGVRDIDGNGDGRGWLGRLADVYCTDPLDPLAPLGIVSVGVGKRRDFQSDDTDPLIMSNVNGFRIDSDNDFPADHDLRKKMVEDQFALEPSPPTEPGASIQDANKQAYDLVDAVAQGTAPWTDPNNRYVTGIGRNSLLSNMREISKMLSGNFGTKVFYTGIGGFDTHSNQTGRHETLMSRINEAVQRFKLDMVDRSRWNDCTIMVVSEFGRRNFENGSDGTDHGHGNVFFVTGGRVQGQQIVGDMENSELTTSARYLGFDYDFREVYANLLADLGADPALIFPETYTNTGDIALY